VLKEWTRREKWAETGTEKTVHALVFFSLPTPFAFWKKSAVWRGFEAYNSLMAGDMIFFPFYPTWALLRRQTFMLKVVLYRCKNTALCYEKRARTTELQRVFLTMGTDRQFMPGNVGTTQTCILT
jgi:hypothetical protein